MIKKIVAFIWYERLQYLPPKFMRKWWCNHKDLLKSGPEVDEMVDMGRETKIECVYCGKSKMVSLMTLWTVGIDNIKLG